MQCIWLTASSFVRFQICKPSIAAANLARLGCDFLAQTPRVSAALTIEMSDRLGTGVQEPIDDWSWLSIVVDCLVA